MGGFFKRIIRETGKAVGIVPSKKEMAQQQKAMEAAAAKVVDAPEPDNPDDVIYAGDQGEDAPKKKKKKKSGTILTSTKGVMGDAPTESKTLLGG